MGGQSQTTGKETEPGIGKGNSEAEPIHDEQQNQGTPGFTNAGHRHFLCGMGGNRFFVFKITRGNKRNKQVFDGSFKDKGNDGDKNKIREKLVKIIQKKRLPDKRIYK